MKNTSQYRSTKKDIVVLHNKNEIPYIAAPHLHSSYEIYYNIRGAEGFMVGGKAYKCSERNLIVIPKILPHKAIVPKNVEYERCIINVSEHTADLVDMITMSAEATAFLHGGPLMVNLDPRFWMKKWPACTWPSSVCASPPSPKSRQTTSACR